MPLESCFEFFRRENSSLEASVLLWDLGLYWQFGSGRPRLLVRPRISSIYLLCAYLSFCFTKCFVSRKAHLSVGRLSLLYVSYKLSLFRLVRLISWVIHGSDGFVLIVCCGTYCSIPDCKAPLDSSQSELIDLPSWEAKKDFWKRSIWFSSLSQSAFLYINLNFGFCLLTCGFI